MQFIVYLYNLRTGEVSGVPVTVNSPDLDYEDVWFEVLDEVSIQTGYQPDDFVEVDLTEIGLHPLH